MSTPRNHWNQTKGSKYSIWRLSSPTVPWKISQAWVALNPVSFYLQGNHSRIKTPEARPCLKAWPVLSNSPGQRHRPQAGHSGRTRPPQAQRLSFPGFCSFLLPARRSRWTHWLCSAVEEGFIVVASPSILWANSPASWVGGCVCMCVCVCVIAILEEAYTQLKGCVCVCVYNSYSWGSIHTAPA